MDRATIVRLTDAVLINHVRTLREQECECTASLIAHLVEVEARRLHLKLGYGSLFAYLTDGLGYPEDAAAKRGRVTRLAHRFPAVLALLASGQLHLSGAVVLAPHLTDDNLSSLLAAARRKSKRAIVQLVADLAPLPDVAPTVRKLPEPAASGPDPQPSLLDGAAVAATIDPPRGGSEALAPTRLNEPVPEPRPPRGGVKSPAVPPKPLGGARFKVTFTAPQALVDKLDRLKAVLSHRVPDGDLAKVLDRALDVAIEAFEKQRFGAPKRSQRRANRAKPGRENLAPAPTPATRPDAAAQAQDLTGSTAEPKPRGSGGSGEAIEAQPAADPATRTVPAPVRREVYERDGGCCTYLGPDGRRCGSTYRIDFDHLIPFALGGPSTVDNLTLRCRAHNLLAAIEVFGPGAVPPGHTRQPHGPSEGHTVHWPSDPPPPARPQLP